jgi:hypothetical protein
MTRLGKLMTTDVDVAEVLRLERELQAANCTLLPESACDERNSRA